MLQGGKKLARIKLLAGDTFGENTLSSIQTYFRSKAVKDEKMPKWRKRPLTPWLPLSPLYTKSGGKTVDAASIKKALTTSQPIFKVISHIILPRPFFVEGQRNTLRQRLIQCSNGSESIKMIRQPLYLQNTAMADIFLFHRGEVLSLSQDSLMNNLEVVARTSNKNESVAAFWQ